VYVTADSVGDFLPGQEAVVAVWCRILNKLKSEVAEEVLAVAPVAVRCIYQGLNPGRKAKVDKQAIGPHKGPRRPIGVTRTLKKSTSHKKHPIRGHTPGQKMDNELVPLCK
jgi:hypothetical protein